MQKNALLSAHLKPKQRAAVAALLTSKTHVEAAEVAGCSVRQIYVWLKDPIFKAELATAQTEIRDTINRRLSDTAGAAVDTIAEIMQGSQSPDGLRLQAAKAIMDYHIKTGDDTDINRRLTDLEARSYGQND